MIFIFLLLSLNTPAHADDLAVLKSSAPKVKWEEESVIKLDLNKDKKPDLVVLGHQGNNNCVGVVVESLQWKESKAKYVCFPYGPNDTFCTNKAKLSRQQEEAITNLVLKDKCGAIKLTWQNNAISWEIIESK